MRPLAACTCALLLAAGAGAELPIERPGRVETLALPYGEHWVWAGDPLLRRAALIDVDDGRMLGMVNAGFGVPVTMTSPNGLEIYVPETHYSRGSRGERTDVLTFYDAGSLAPTAEVVLPAKRAHNAVPVANEALTDDGRFAAVFNMTPATSLSIVDLAERRLAGEISTPGCSLVYGAGRRRFVLLCMDGALLTLDLDERGGEAAKRRSEPFFDPEKDPVTEKAVRWHGRWLFVSFAGRVHPVDVSGEEPTFGEPWPLIEAADSDWRIGGSQHLAVHQDSSRLYSLVHVGGADTHKDAGTEVWVYDLEARERVQRIELESPGYTYLGVPLEFGRDWVWPLHRLSDWLLALLPSPGIDFVAVTQDDEPRLVTASFFSGGMAVYDATSGAFLGRVYTGNLTIGSLGLSGAWR